MLIWSKVLRVNSCVQWLFQIPLPPLTKIQRFIIECKTYWNNTKKGQEGFDKKQKKLKEELENTEVLTNISMILEASLESSFQFVFQGTFYLPILILAFMDIDGANELTDLVDWKIVSIILSFFTYSLTSYNMRFPHFYH